MASFQSPPPDGLVTSLNDEVRGILAERLNHDESSIAWESSIAAISDDESLPELWLALEDFFDIELDDDDVQSVRTARDVVNVVRVRLSERVIEDPAVNE
jgi:acyl carrier protein